MYNFDNIIRIFFLTAILAVKMLPVGIPNLCRRRKPSWPRYRLWLFSYSVREIPIIKYRPWDWSRKKKKNVCHITVYVSVAPNRGKRVRVKVYAYEANGIAMETYGIKIILKKYKRKKTQIKKYFLRAFKPDTQERMWKAHQRVRVATTCGPGRVAVRSNP